MVQARSGNLQGKTENDRNPNLTLEPDKSEEKLIIGFSAFQQKICELEEAEKNFQEKLKEVDGELQSAAREWDAALQADHATRKKIMTRLNELLNRRSYIRNLVTNVAKELAEV